MEKSYLAWNEIERGNRGYFLRGMPQQIPHQTWPLLLWLFQEGRPDGCLHRKGYLSGSQSHQEVQSRGPFFLSWFTGFPYFPFTDINGFVPKADHSCKGRTFVMFRQRPHCCGIGGRLLAKRTWKTITKAKFPDSVLPKKLINFIDDNGKSLRGLSGFISRQNDLFSCFKNHPAGILDPPTQKTEIRRENLQHYRGGPMKVDTCIQ